MVGKRTIGWYVFLVGSKAPITPPLVGSMNPTPYSKRSPMSFFRVQQRGVIYAPHQVQTNSIQTLEGFIFQRRLDPFGRYDYGSLFFRTLPRKKQPAIITALVLRLSHNIAKSIFDFLGIVGSQESKISPNAHMLSDGMPHIRHSDLTHQDASPIIEKNCRTGFDLNCNPRTMLQLQLAFHYVKLPLHDAALSLHLGRLILHNSGLSIYRTHTISPALDSQLRFVGLQGYENESQKSNNYQPPIGPFEGCVPLWRVAIGFFGMCFGAFVMFKSGRRFTFLTGALLVLVSSLIWLTGHQDCKQEQSQKTDSCEFEHPLQAAFSDQKIGSIPSSWVSWMRTTRL